MKKLVSIRGRHIAAVTALFAAALLLVACNEIPQDARKPFAGDAEVRLQSAPAFGGDREKLDQVLAERAHHSDEYRVTGGAKQ